MCIHLPFDSKKATQVLNYFAIQNGNVISKYKVLKLVFFADRYHLRKYGRPVTGDEYYAMQNGPVPSGTKDIAQLADDYQDDIVIAYAAQFICPLFKENAIKSIKEVDFNELSDSDREALNFAWSTFGHYDDQQIVEKTHDYPEWKKHAAVLSAGRRVRMDLMDFLKDPPPSVEQCFPLTEKERAIRCSQLRETHLIEAMWN